MQELELKVELSKSDVMRLGGQLGCDPAIGLPAIKGQRTVYFDTPEHSLDAAGFSLRLTRQDGHWSQTIKANRHVADGIASPVELECPIARREPDIAKITDKNTLEFKWDDSFNNSGTGTITRTGNGIIVSMKTVRVVDSRCLPFYGQNMRLTRVGKGT